jgi:hypothetical protein
MADISMCINEFCPIKNICYRYRAIADEFRQSYADFNYVITDKKEVKCDHYLDVKEYDKSKVTPIVIWS